PGSSSSCPHDLADLVGFQDVALLDVLEVVDPDAAFESLLDLVGVLFETLQRGDLGIGHHDAVAQEAHLRAARDRAFLDVAAGDEADLRNLERRPDDRPAEDTLLELRLEHAL